MTPLFKENQYEFDGILPNINADFDSWFVLAIATNESYTLPYDEMIGKIADLFGNINGIVYNQGYFSVICLAKFGSLREAGKQKQRLVRALPDGPIFVSLQKLTKNTLDALQKSFMLPPEDPDNLYEKRYARGDGKALVIDDDPMIRATMKKVLGLESLDIAEVSEGNKALDAYLEHNPDVVFLDIHMPGKTGLEVINQIFEKDINAYIVMLSADRGEGVVMKAIERGAAGYIAKPLEKTKVMTYLKKCVTFN